MGAGEGIWKDLSFSVDCGTSSKEGSHISVCTCLERAESQIHSNLVVSIILIAEAIIIDRFPPRKHLGSELSIKGVFWKNEIAGDKSEDSGVIHEGRVNCRQESGESRGGGTGYVCPVN